jgi:hypothetical protein
MTRQQLPEQHGFDFRQAGQRQQVIPQRRSLAPGRGGHYQQEQVETYTKRPTRHRNVQRLDRPTRLGTPMRAEMLEEEYEEESPQRIATVHYRYDIGLDGLPTQGRRTRVENHYHDEPLETEGLPAQRRRYVSPQTRRHIHIHWFVFAGVGAIIALTVWIGAAYLNVWWTNTQNDWTYTQAFRTFSLDKAVGHNGDSNARPSHYIVQNDNRHIIIIELPANDVSKALIYSGPFLVGDGEERTPVTISFVENLQTGRLDMVLHVQDQTYVFANNGTKFVPPPGGE